jgi:ribonuclease P protein component
MVERERRLRRAYEVRQTRSKGRPYADGPLVARIRRNPAHPELNRYAVVAGKSVGGAVDRNRLKRLVREAVRRLDSGFNAGHDIVIIVRGRREELPSLSDTEAVLTRIARRAGLLDSDEEPDRPGLPTASLHESAHQPEH